MSFDYNIDDIAIQFNIRKDHVKRRLIKYAFEENKDFKITFLSKSKQGGQNKETITLTKSTYNQLITHFALVIRKSNVTSKDIKIDFVQRFLPEETEILDFIYDVLSPLHQIKKQYIVLRYRLDMYIIDKNIAIECDEYDHKDRDIDYEEKREKDIISELNCTFIRFNPHAKDFKLTALLSQILIILQKRL
jgi:very-short-patch-repair endonuclease